ncbi:hypothetical protein MF271_22300 (plasmid) [Deinococcus sp. KNUC1210]|uniref:hypothetical protein n=1 Tax=Deinococcus sp. KNUC1210 TaxID=2917691 RepID=UPI001EF01B70|nr:hypothetical protein [Deinococcus sp. KNUC1210]ULH18204.1 hypothetical protein MF271_22300 [Deinococcus sp. KNUC1210]
MIYHGQELYAFLTPGTQHEQVYTVFDDHAPPCTFLEQDIVERATTITGRTRVALRRTSCSRVFERRARARWLGHPVYVHFKDGTPQAHIITDDDAFAVQHNMQPEYHDRWYATVPVDQLTELTYTETNVAG